MYINLRTTSNKNLIIWSLGGYRIDHPGMNYMIDVTEDEKYQGKVNLHFTEWNRKSYPAEPHYIWEHAQAAERVLSLQSHGKVIKMSVFIVSFQTSALADAMLSLQLFVSHAFCKTGNFANHPRSKDCPAGMALETKTWHSPERRDKEPHVCACVCMKCVKVDVTQRDRVNSQHYLHLIIAPIHCS